jgi:hypothetical protein
MIEKQPKRPRDPNQLAKRIIDLATGDVQEPAPHDPGADDHAGRGGLKGGKSRAEKLTPEERSAIARSRGALEKELVRRCSDSASIF